MAEFERMTISDADKIQKAATVDELQSLAQADNGCALRDGLLRDYTSFAQRVSVLKQIESANKISVDADSKVSKIELLYSAQKHDGSIQVSLLSKKGVFDQIQVFSESYHPKTNTSEVTCLKKK